jgi:Protein of unknown function (DUF664)
MTNSDHPWEPPLAGTETEHIVGALDRLRTTFRWKADALDAAGLQVRTATSSLTLGGLLKHLAAVEDYYFTAKMRGEPMGAPWDSTGWDGSNDWEFQSAADDTPDELYALWDGRRRAVSNEAGRGLGRRGSRPTRPRVPVRRSPRQHAPAPLRFDRGVRPAHRTCRPDPRGGGRASRRRPSSGMASGLGPVPNQQLTLARVIGLG